MKKNFNLSFAVLCALFALVLMGCPEPETTTTTTEVTETIPEGFVKVVGTTIIGADYENNYTGAFPAGRTVTLSDFYMSKY